MTRRLQLLEPESRSSGRSVSAVIARVRDGLLRDNKVIPAVLGILALLIFAWLVAGALIGGPGDEKQQASNQASLAQGTIRTAETLKRLLPVSRFVTQTLPTGATTKAPKTPSAGSFRRLAKKTITVVKTTGAATEVATRTTGTIGAPTEAGAATAGTATRAGGATAESAWRILSSKGLLVDRTPEASPAVAKVAPTEAVSDRPARVRTVLAKVTQGRPMAAEAFSTVVATCRRREHLVPAQAQNLAPCRREALK
jgi:hypothetical protein